MTRTKQYTETVATFREALRKASADYDEGLARIEKYKGSPAYNEELKKLNATRKDAIEAARTTAWDSFAEVLTAMRKAATSKPMIPPTQEQLAVLSALKMRSQISADELRQAALSVGDCPLALSVLDDIAHDHGHMGLHFGKESTDGILRHIDTLTASAKKIVRMEAVDRKREAVEAASPWSANYDPQALELFAVDRDFRSEADALAWLGGVNDVDAFSAAVN